MSRRPGDSRPERPRRKHARSLLYDRLEERITPADFNLVPGVADGSPGSLRDALQQADSNFSADNTINLAAGDYQLSDTGAGNLLVEDSDALPAETLTIVGQGTSNTIIEPADSSWKSRILEIVGTGTVKVTVVLRDLTLRGGKAEDGGLVGGTAALGGGLLVDGGTVTLSDVAVTGNVVQGRTAVAGLSGTTNFSSYSAGKVGVKGEAAKGGGVYLAKGTLTLNNSDITSNQAIGGQGGQGEPAMWRRLAHLAKRVPPA